MSKKETYIGSRFNAFNVDPDDLVIIGLDTEDGPEHPLYEERIHLKLDEAMIKNIMAKGVTEVVTVTKMKGPDGEVMAVVVNGRQRVRCAREAKKRQEAEGLQTLRVPCQIKSGTDAHLIGLSATANSFRQEDSHLQKATRAQKMLDNGYDVDEAASYFGVTSTTINKWISLLSCDKSVIKALEAGKIKTSAAYELAALDRKEQKEQLKELLETVETNGKVTVAEVAAKVRGKGKDGAHKYKGLKKSTARKLHKLRLEAEQEGSEVSLPELSDEFWSVVALFSGDLFPEQYSAELADLLRELGE